MLFRITVAYCICSMLVKDKPLLYTEHNRFNNFQTVCITNLNYILFNILYVKCEPLMKLLLFHIASKLWIVF